MTRELFERKRAPTSADANAPRSAAHESPRVACDPSEGEAPAAGVTAPTATNVMQPNQAPKFLLGIWLVVGAVGLVYGLSGRGGESSPAVQPSVPLPPAPHPSYSQAPPQPPAATASIYDVKVARQVTGPFDQIINQRDFVGAPTPLGVTFRHDGYGRGDSIEVEFYFNGVLASQCDSIPLNSSARPIYSCQFTDVGLGAGEFRLLINGQQAGAYPFTIRAEEREDAPITPPASRAPPRQSDRQSVRARANRDSPPATAREPTVTCILPNGDELALSRTACRASSGVIL